MRILVAPSGFKESLDAEATAHAIERGIHRASPHVAVQRLPLVDGGEGFTAGVVAAVGGRLVDCTVTGPVGLPVASRFGLLDAGPDGAVTGVIEMAAAAGLRLVPRSHRDPGRTTTQGVGELMLAALDAGATRLLIGCGDSGTNDGGVGMARALGVRFLAADGSVLDGFGDSLDRVADIDPSGMDPRIAVTPIDVACNPCNLLCGPRGVARVFGPQKGASTEQVEHLARGLDVYADVIRRVLGVDVRYGPGTGASGGLGAGLVAFCGATLVPRFELVSRFVDLDAAIADADLVITAEGSLDAQTPNGKIPGEVARRAAVLGKPVVALAGTLGDGARASLDLGLTGFFGILRRPCSLGEAIEHADEWVADCAEQIVRVALIGMQAVRPLAA